MNNTDKYKKVYLAFLGLGSKNIETGKFDYKTAKYVLNEKISSETKYVQIAELELLGKGYFDKIIIVGTKKTDISEGSLDVHYEKLLDEANAIGVDEHIFRKIEITDPLNYKSEWEWLNKILAEIENNDTLVVDLTHGFRSSSIVFSAAINLLIKTKNINLEAAYYGAYDSPDEIKPIINMKDYYIVNNWADGVMRLVEVGDSKKLIDLISTGNQTFNVGELNNEQLKNAIVKVTDGFRNVDINNIYNYTKNLLDVINNILNVNTLSEISKILLNKIRVEFSPFAPESFNNNIYNKDYFEIQLKIIEYLIKHRLFMQAYTVMNELIASIGILGSDRGINQRYDNSEGRGRRSYANIFLRMVSNEENNWKFTDEEQVMKDKLMNFYKKLSNKNIIVELRNLVKEIKPIRDGLDHAWTSKPKMEEDLENKSYQSYEKLKYIIIKLFEYV